MDGEPETAGDATSYGATKADRALHVRLINLCRGLQHATLAFEYPRSGNYESVLSRIAESMRSTGAGVACPRPSALTGIVRTSGRAANLLDAPGGNVIGEIANRTPVEIRSVQEKWYKIVEKDSAFGGIVDGGDIKVDQFVDVGFDRQFIQIGSATTRNDAESYARLQQPPLDFYLAVNGAYAMTWPETFAVEEAEERLRGMKESGTILNQSILRYGNSYVMRVCC